MKPKIIYGQPMQRMSECRVIFGHCGRSFISPAMYEFASYKIIVMSGSVLRASIHFNNASTDAVHMLRLPSWVHCYICCIVSEAKP